MQSFIAAADPASKVAAMFTTPEDFGAALAKGYIPVRQDGTAYVTQTFEGGVLLDGAPLNVYFRGLWYPEQRELLAPHWGKDIPKPADSIINLPLTTDAEAQQALVDYHGWKSSVDSIAGIPTQWLLIGAAGVAAWWFFFRK